MSMAHQSQFGKKCYFAIQASCFSLHFWMQDLRGPCMIWALFSSKEKPIPVFLSGEFHGQRSLVGNSPRVTKNQTQLSDSHTHTHTASISYILLLTCMPQDLCHHFSFQKTDIFTSLYKHFYFCLLHHQSFAILQYWIKSHLLRKILTDSSKQPSFYFTQSVSFKL